MSLDEQLMPGTLEYAINHVVEDRLDLSMFDGRYSNDETGRKAIDPLVGVALPSGNGGRFYFQLLGRKDSVSVMPGAHKESQPKRSGVFRA